MYCKKCGAHLKDLARFCDKCGTQVKNPVTTEEKVEHLQVGIPSQEQESTFTPDISVQSEDVVRNSCPISDPNAQTMEIKPVQQIEPDMVNTAPRADDAEITSEKVSAQRCCCGVSDSDNGLGSDFFGSIFCYADIRGVC